MEPFRLIVVEDVVVITGRGFFLMPGLPVNTLPHRIRVGDKIELRRPEGSCISTVIAGIEHAKLLRVGSTWPLRLPESIREGDVPVGTEVWWISSEKSLEEIP
jgi:hypothetical protein